MKEMDEIENLFSSAFANEEITPPSSVKRNIDAKLFGGNTLLWKSLYSLLFIGVMTLLIGLTVQSDTNDGKNSEIRKTNTITASNSKITTSTNQYIDSPISSNTNKDINSTHSIDFQNSTSVDVFKHPHQNDISTEAISEINVRKVNDITDSIVDESTKNGSKMKIETNLAKNESDIGPSVVPVDGGKDVVTLSSTMSRINSSSTSLMDDKINENLNLSNETKNKFENEKSDISRLNYLPLSNFELLDPSLNVNPNKSVHKKNRLLSLSLYNGFTVGNNNLKTTTSDVKLSESAGFSTALNLDLRIRPSIGAGIGFEYGTHKESYIENSLVVGDSLIINSYYTFSPNPNDTTLMDSTLVVEYGENLVNKATEYRVQQSSFSIPLSVQYYKALSPRMELKVSALARFSFLKGKQISNVDNSSIQFNQFNFSVGVRPELRYHWAKFGIGVYGQFMKDFKTGSSWENTDRKRFSYGGGVSLFVNF